jgi:hypothetical protein
MRLMVATGLTAAVNVEIARRWLLSSPLTQPPLVAAVAMITTKGAFRMVIFALQKIGTAIPLIASG